MEQRHPKVLKVGHHNSKIAIISALSLLVFAPYFFLEFAWILIVFLSPLSNSVLVPWA